MINTTQYSTTLGINGRLSGLANYPEYILFENDWMDYYKNIFLKNYNKQNQIRLIIAESAPEGIYPNGNYAFDIGSRTQILNYHRDKYLYNYFRGVFPLLPTNISKENALIRLSKENVLILDLLPTHGIKLKSSERNKLNTDPAKFAEIGKILGLPILKGNFNYAFSVPPNSYSTDFLKPHLPTNFVEFGNVNTGQGHAPSQRAIQSIITDGF